MFTELHRIGEVSRVFEQIPMYPEIERVYDSLKNQASLEDFEKWLRIGIQKANPQAKDVVDLFEGDELVVVGGNIKDPMLKNGNRCFVGIITGYDMGNYDILTIGRYANDPDITEIIFHPDADSLMWDIIEKPKLKTQ